MVLQSFWTFVLKIGGFSLAKFTLLKQCQNYFTIKLSQSSDRSIVYQSLRLGIAESVAIQCQF